MCGSGEGSHRGGNSASRWLDQNGEKTKSTWCKSSKPQTFTVSSVPFGGGRRREEGPERGTRAAKPPPLGMVLLHPGLNLKTTRRFETRELKHEVTQSPLRDTKDP